MKNNPHFLFEKLREKRNKLAKEANIKPYMILHNKVLKTIAENNPTTLEELGKIKGMGEKKLAKYGNIILETINGTITEEKTNKAIEKTFTVYEYLNFLNQILAPAKAVIIGEISSVNDRGRYIYFTLHDKNEDASLNCFIWQSTLVSLGIELKEGLEVKISGYPKVYEKFGKLSFEVQQIGLIGEGALKLAFEKLKKRLEKEGYFDIARKKTIPKYVESIGLITSKYGDAQNDFITHLGNYGFKIYFYDVRVEGLYALDEVINSIRWFNENMTNVDVLVIVRGGGSLESLQTFNSETIAKAIYGSKIPIITGIGHENDTTIADLVADMRASTPTHAARILSDPWRSVSDFLTTSKDNLLALYTAGYNNYLQHIDNLQNTLFNQINKIIKEKRQNLSNLQNNLGYQFSQLIQKVKQIQIKFFNNREILRRLLFQSKFALIHLNKSLVFEFERSLSKLKNNLTIAEQKLNLASPTLRLKQGYSIILNTQRKIVKSSQQLKIGDLLKLKFYQGGASSKVEDIEK